MLDRLGSATAHAVGIVEQACQLAGKLSFISDLRRDFRSSGLLAAIDRHDTPLIFDWLIDTLSYQGIANSVAEGFLLEHGNVRYDDIAAALVQSPSCAKLSGHWHFNDCAYQKSSQTCSEPLHFGTCPLPDHHLRNGRLNQTAYSLFLFMRDVADGDFVAWIDHQLSVASREPVAEPLGAMRDALIDPMRSIYGISHKVVVMAGAAGCSPTSLARHAGSTPLCGAERRRTPRPRGPASRYQSPRQRGLSSWHCAGCVTAQGPTSRPMADPRRGSQVAVGLLADS